MIRWSFPEVSCWSLSRIPIDMLIVSPSMWPLGQSANGEGLKPNRQKLQLISWREASTQCPSSSQQATMSTRSCFTLSRTSKNKSYWQIKLNFSAGWCQSQSGRNIISCSSNLAHAATENLCWASLIRTLASIYTYKLMNIHQICWLRWCFLHILPRFLALYS